MVREHAAQGRRTEPARRVQARQYRVDISLYYLVEDLKWPDTTRLDERERERVELDGLGGKGHHVDAHNLSGCGASAIVDVELDDRVPRAGIDGEPPDQGAFLADDDLCSRLVVARE